MKPMTKCRYASRYKAQRPPTCGCDYCELLWRIADALAVSEKSSNRASQAASTALYVANYCR